ncbi:hypothetical protein ADUPG1_005908 [Aduncisulcus paluster]|uniref:DUF4200 domain-containing protein n=1 Tax=Aduncisulcus paluster TaxID=2918883 RepID=A0ABQ5KKL8_9EUKA|nr:hypothetical protein ADUPG1_005908 [Aduncisulcus paluster]|eukprot:gnl/Carplike_NY0171/9318_a13003_162.p1 GENE.gnl/Carplike_NY0171/9318_a13003_162~~gnl/Carplike_NY0171/9318_a13003_162.p1  ORF type:complete len:287 (-),score=56.42 gnl/Carplike_NY0171/9318_a13003_162:13-873(-)
MYSFISGAGGGPEETGISDTTILLQHKRELVSVEDQLREKKEEFFYIQKKHDHKEMILDQRRTKQQAQKDRFQKFIDDSKIKITRAEKRAKEEEKVSKSLEKEIIELKKRIQKKGEEASTLSNITMKLSKYEGFLRSVLDCAAHFSSIDEFITRIHALELANKKLKEQMDKNRAEVIVERGKLDLIERKERTEALKLSNAVSSARHAREESILQRAVVERKLAGIEDRAFETCKTESEAILAINNMYKTMLNKTHIKREVRVDTIDAKLANITEYLEDLEKIVSTK